MSKFFTPGKDIGAILLIIGFFFLLGPLGQTARIVAGEIESGQTSVGYSMFVYLVWVGEVIIFYCVIVFMRFFKSRFVDTPSDYEFQD